MEKKRDSFIFYASFWEAMKKMNRSDRLAFVDALCAYALDDVSPALSGDADLAFTLVKPQLDANNVRFENGKKGGRPKKTDGFQNEKPMVFENGNHSSENEKPNVNVNVNVNDNVYILSDKEKNDILLRFFFKNFLDPEKELERYIEWGKSTGWRKSSGREITDKVAYASMWKAEQEGTRFPLRFLEGLKAAYTSLYTSHSGIDLVKAVLGITRVQEAGDTYAIYSRYKDTAALKETLEKLVPMKVQVFCLKTQKP